MLTSRFVPSADLPLWLVVVAAVIACASLPSAHPGNPLGKSTHRGNGQWDPGGSSPTSRHTPPRPCDGSRKSSGAARTGACRRLPLYDASPGRGSTSRGKGPRHLRSLANFLPSAPCRFKALARARPAPPRSILGLHRSALQSHGGPSRPLPIGGGKTLCHRGRERRPVGQSLRGASAESLAELARSVGVPIHTLATTEKEPRDASIRSVSLPGAAVAHVPVPLRIQVGCASRRNNL